MKLGQRSRIDLTLQTGERRTWIEVKSVTMVDGNGRYAFPEAVNSRGAKHLRELARAVGAGDRGVMFYLIQRSDGSGFTAADDIDPGYGEALRRAIEAGVQVLVYRADVRPNEIRVAKRIGIELR